MQHGHQCPCCPAIAGLDNGIDLSFACLTPVISRSQNDAKPISPICGSIIDKDSEFQWCANDIYPDYVDCKRCKKLAIKIVTNRMEDIVKRFNVRAR